MKYGSVCSGIEAASVAWKPLGWQAQWYSEIEHFPSAVLAHRFPTVPNLGDMTKIHETEIFNGNSIDLLVGGTPCQSFSVAGLRKGLADPRGNLMLTFLSLAQRKKPRWIVWENVPGVLSSNGGRDFGTFLQALAELGYGFAYRVLDAQYFGVAQRRRRVFVVGYLGDWRPAGAVLFEQDCLSGNTKKSREKRKATSADAQGGVGATGFAGNIESQVAACLQTTCDDYSRADGFNTVIEQVAHPFAIQGNLIGREKGGPQGIGVSQDGGMYTMTKTDVHGVAQPIAIASKQYSQNIGNNIANPLLADDYKEPQVVAQPIAVDLYNGTIQGQTACTLTSEMGVAGHSGPKLLEPIAMDCFNQTINEKTSQTIGSSASDVNHYDAVLEPKAVDFRNSKIDGDVTMTLQSKPNGGYSVNYQPGVLQTMAIRRLTPVECEKLQGFPPNWTKIPYRNKPADQCPDGPRYKACGNSMAVPVMRWIGQRIQMVESLMKEIS